MNEKRGFGINWGYLLIGILYVFTGFAAFQDPTGSLLAVVFVFAISAIFKGIFEIIVRFRIKQATGYKGYFYLVAGLLNIIVGILLLFNLTAGLVALPFVFATWFILDSTFNLVNAGHTKVISTGYYWFSVFMNIIGIIVGIMLFFDPIFSALTFSFMVGFYFMMSGITFVVYAFTGGE